MAKRRPPMSLSEMQDLLGYSIDSSADMNEDGSRFYSDLTKAPVDVYEKTKDELEEHLRSQGNKQPMVTHKNFLPVLGKPHRITDGQYSTLLRRGDHVGQYIFSADVSFGLGFDLRLKLTESEALETMSVAKIPRHSPLESSSPLFRLPRELRDTIYMYAIPQADLHTTGGEFGGLALARGIGDPSGFYYPFRSNLGILAVNKQTRGEALGLAYRQSSIELEDMDDFILFGVSIGKIGRDNLESIGFTWESRSDSASIESEVWKLDIDTIRLPALHTARCVEILELFPRLKFLQVTFEDDVVSNLSNDEFQNESGIQKLRAFAQMSTVRLKCVTESGTPIQLRGAI